MNVKHKTWAEIDLRALRGNYCEIKKNVADKTEVMCVVKADAYGHGAERCAVALYEVGARWFAVSCIEEAMILRSAFDAKLYYGSKILILGYTPPENASALARYDIRQTVFSSEYARALSDEAVKQGCAVRVHFKLDTGMNRIGYRADDGAAEKILASSALEGLAPEGLFTHFACADEENDDVTEVQFGKFIAVRDELRSRGLDLLCHVCNSASLMRYPEYHLDMVRAGIILYGLEPYYPYEQGINLVPVMTFKSIISHIHTVLSGEKISYGGTYSADDDITVATVPVGYADGFVRDFGRGGSVYIGDAKAPIVGRICMDQCMVDISGIKNASIGDEVVLFGGDPDRIRELARIADTINYEIVCLIGKRVTRVYDE